jgi:outer membrane protein OmpA-like peptidoglycan-associated protein
MNRMFAARSCLYLSFLFCCAACDTLPPLQDNTEAPVRASAPQAAQMEQVKTEQAEQVEQGEQADDIRAFAPEAVYALEAGKNVLPESVEQSLRGIAERMRARRDLVIRLESYVPDSGSREMSIGLSRQAVSHIRRRLVELGVPSYRVKQSLLGAEHPDDAVRLDQRRVELFVLPLPR